MRRDFRRHYFGGHKRLTKERCEEFLAMMQISLTFSGPPLLSPRTADYVSALVREGDKFDYCKWLQRVREEEAQAKRRPQRSAERIAPEEIDIPVSTCGRRVASPNGKRTPPGHVMGKTKNGEASNGVTYPDVALPPCSR